MAVAAGGDRYNTSFETRASRAPRDGPSGTSVRRVGKGAKRRAHVSLGGGHASLCPPYQTYENREVSKLLQDPAVPDNAVLDAAAAQRVPVGHRIDGEHRLAEPAFGLGGDRNRCQRGTDLHQRV